MRKEEFSTYRCQGLAVVSFKTNFTQASVSSYQDSPVSTCLLAGTTAMTVFEEAEYELFPDHSSDCQFPKPHGDRTKSITIYLGSISKLTHKLFNHRHCHIRLLNHLGSW